jgi:alpha-beta hydrolase superfamily lysophospholipase
MARPCFRTFCLGGLLPAWLLLSGCLRIPLDDGTVFQPKDSVYPAIFDEPGAELEEVFFAGADGTRLNGWYLRQEDAEQTVLFMGGYMFYLVQSRPYLDFFLRNDLNAFLWDYRGYGRSEGEPSVETLLADAREAYRWLREEKGVAPAEIIVHGHSLGSFPAAEVAAEEPVGGVVLESPLTSAEDWSKTILPWYLQPLLGFEISEDIGRADNRERAAEWEAPLLLVVGEDDPITPVKMAERLYAEIPEPDKRLLVVEGRNHDDLPEDPAFDEGYAWLRAQMAERAGERER